MAYELDELFYAALKAVRDNYVAAPIHADVLGKDLRIGQDIGIDKLVKLTFGERQIEYYMEIKANLTRANIGQYVQRKKLLPGPLLIVANYINEAMAERLRENRIEFMDAAGNAYIDQPPIYIYTKGNKVKDKFLKAPPGRAFRPAGLKVVFVFLCDPPMINKNYPTIARTAGVALGNIGGIIMDLKREGFLVDRGKQGFKLIQKQRLLDRFVEDYPTRLRRKLLLGMFRGGPGWWGRKPLDLANAYWGGEVAAAIMTNYLKPQTATVYLKREGLNEFLLQNRLKKDDQGDVEILELFWDPAHLRDDKGLVHPILTYADLIATADQRNIEAAKIIYEQDVVRFVRED
ncbi:MAG: hypothetical protein JW775_02090 [Candidatus Aminicenantes bacterium]|nr:hypothetical protein [Candidatus Aminicenantes bacterium]